MCIRDSEYAAQINLQDVLSDIRDTIQEWEAQGWVVGYHGTRIYSVPLILRYGIRPSRYSGRGGHAGAFWLGDSRDRVADKYPYGHVEHADGQGLCFGSHWVGELPGCNSRLALRATVVVAIERHHTASVLSLIHISEPTRPY